MKVIPIDPLDIDDALAGRMAEIASAVNVIDDPDGMAPTAESIRLARRYGHDNRPSDAMWLAVDDDGVVWGYAGTELTQWDNPQIAFVGATAHPDRYGDGTRTMLLDAAVDCARELGRTQLMTWSNGGGEAEGFYVRHGFEPGLRMARRTLYPRQVDPATIQRLHDDAASHATDYELVRLDGPVSEEMLPQLIEVFAAINDAPLDDLDVEPDEFPVERLRAYDAAMVGRRQRVCRVLARHRPTGDWAGHTILCVDGLRPGLAFQEDTTVVNAHRGHRLGLLLKAHMLLWMRDECPELERIDTTNAFTNTHMIAVNEALGCVVTGSGVGLQRQL